jgi:hypothetical protein
MSTPQLEVDIEALWPCFSAKFNISRTDLAKLIVKAETHLDMGLVFQRTKDYMEILITAYAMYGDQLTAALLATDQSAMIRAMVKASEENLEFCSGINMSALHGAICHQYVKDDEPYEANRYLQLAATIIHLSWLDSTTVSAAQQIADNAQVIDQIVLDGHLSFPAKGFSKLVAAHILVPLGLPPSPYTRSSYGQYGHC